MRSSSYFFDSYVDAPQRWVDARVRIKNLYDINRRNTIASTDSDELLWLSRVADTINGKDYMSHKIAVLDGSWILDGTCEIISLIDMPASLGFWGKWPSYNNGNINYSVSYELRSPVNPPDEMWEFPGLTIFFDDKHNLWATDFTIDIYKYLNSTTPEQTITITGHSGPVFVLNQHLSSVREIKITFTKMSEGNRLFRFSGIEFGPVDTINKRDLMSLRVIEEASIDNSALPYGTLEFAFDIKSRGELLDKMWQGLPIDIDIGIGDNPNNIEYIYFGRYYFYKSEYKEGELGAKIIAYDMLYQLDNIEYPYGTVGTAGNDVVMDMLLYNRGIEYDVGTPVTIGKAFPITSIRDCIRLVAQASAKTCIKRDEVLEFVNIGSGSTVATINDNRMLEYPNKVTSEKVKEVQVKINEIKKTAETRSIVFDGKVRGVMNSGPRVYLTHPATDLIATLDGNSEFIIGYLRVAVLPFVWAGLHDLVIEGYRDEVSGQLLIKTNADGKKNILIDNPLIVNETIADSVGTWLKQLYNYTTSWEIVDRGDPRLQIGDVVTLDYKGAHNCVIIKQEFVFDGSLTAYTTLLEVPT